MTNPAEIHKGLNTHHHDQLIILTNFKPINKTVNKPVNPIPLDDVLFELLLKICISFLYSIHLTTYYNFILLISQYPIFITTKCLFYSLFYFLNSLMLTHTLKCSYSHITKVLQFYVMGEIVSFSLS